MSEKLYACVISRADKRELEALGDAFSYRIERLDDGVLFDVSGLEKMYGRAADIAKRIREQMDERGIAGDVAVAANAQTSVLLARNKSGTNVSTQNTLDRIPLEGIGIDYDTLGVFEALGLRSVRDLKQIPESDLIERYGGGFKDVLDLIRNQAQYVLTPNFKENYVIWSYQLDFPVNDAEQLIFIIRHGLEKVFVETERYGLKTERIGMTFELEDQTSKDYEIKVSFPTLDIKFWLRVITLRINSEAPEAGITSIRLTSHFIRPRTVQKGLFSAPKPQPESLLLTVLKIKKVVGEENVGVPSILDRRIPGAFTLDPAKLPRGDEKPDGKKFPPAIVLNYFTPPLSADVMVNQNRLIYLRTKSFQGKVREYSGVWIGSSQWWNDDNWSSREWDVELEEGGIYRLLRNNDGWFVTGEYD